VAKHINTSTVYSLASTSTRRRLI